MNLFIVFPDNLISTAQANFHSVLTLPSPITISTELKMSPISTLPTPNILPLQEDMNRSLSEGELLMDVSLTDKESSMSPPQYTSTPHKEFGTKKHDTEENLHYSSTVFGKSHRCSPIVPLKNGEKSDKKKVLRPWEVSPTKKRKLVTGFSSGNTDGNSYLMGRSYSPSSNFNFSPLNRSERLLNSHNEYLNSFTSSASSHSLPINLPTSSTILPYCPHLSPPCMCYNSDVFPLTPPPTPPLLSSATGQPKQNYFLAEQHNYILSKISSSVLDENIKNQLLNTYERETKFCENERLKQLQTAVDPQDIQAFNLKFNSERIQIINVTLATLQSYICDKVDNNYTIYEGNLRSNNITDMTLSGDQSCSLNEEITGKGPLSSPSQCFPDQNNRPKRFLNRGAVILMEHWYQQNFEHPYPGDAVVQQLAVKGDITVTQVKKWMANKRVRSCNTLSFNGSIHPKRMKRIKHYINSSPIPSTDSTMEQRFSSPQSSSNSLTYNGSMKPPAIKQMKRSMTEQTKYVLEQFLSQRHSVAAPTPTELHQLCLETGLQEQQLLKWLTERQSRALQLQQLSLAYMNSLFGKTFSSRKSSSTENLKTTASNLSSSPNSFVLSTPNLITHSTSVLPTDYVRNISNEQTNQMNE